MLLRSATTLVADQKDHLRDYIANALVHYTVMTLTPSPSEDLSVETHSRLAIDSAVFVHAWVVTLRSKLIFTGVSRMKSARTG